MSSSSSALATDLPFTWRISRYDPARRNARGSYTVETWTSIADVGRVFDRETLTLEEYERVENLYADAVQAFAQEAGVDRLQIRQFEAGPEGLRNGLVLSVRAAKDIVRAMLREEIQCKLESPANDFFVHIGFDLYMFVGATRPCREARERTEAGGLFVEADWPSPYIVRE